jgi:hypothetical protein
MPAFEGWASLGIQRQESFQALFRRWARRGELLSADQFKKLPGTDALWQFKRARFRILACWRGRDIVLLVVLTKGSQKLPKTERKRAEGICQDDTGGHEDGAQSDR